MLEENLLYFLLKCSKIKQALVFPIVESKESTKLYSKNKKFRDVKIVLLQHVSISL